MSTSSKNSSWMVPAALLTATTTALFYHQSRRWQRRKRSTQTTAYESLIERGTPLVRLDIVSEMLGRSIYVKLESMNPGGTGKDRAAYEMILDAENEGLLPPPTRGNNTGTHQDFVKQENTFPVKALSTTERELVKWIHAAMKKSRTGGLVVEGTSGSTGIALATLCAARGHACLVVLPDDQAEEKQRILRTLGACVHVVPTAAISNPRHYVRLARQVAHVATNHLGIPAVFTDQFESFANFSVHYSTTGPELLKQCPSIDAFVMSSGTGGTIAGVGTYLKEQDPKCQVVLVDPPGSALYNKVEHGVAYASEQSERTLKRHRYDTLAEGIGLDRMTWNFAQGVDMIDRAIRVTDQEAVDMAHWILQTEGLWVGSSSAMNLVGAMRVALDLPPDSKVVTMICDGGQRHVTRFWNPQFIKAWGLEWPEANKVPDIIKTTANSDTDTEATCQESSEDEDTYADPDLSDCLVF